MNQGRFSGAGVGTYTAALSLDGNPTSPASHVEQWNGSTWTEIADLTTGVDNREGAGTVTSALGFGGYGNPSSPSPTRGFNGITESWNGSAWSEVADLNTSRGILGGGGASNTDALACGGIDGSDNRRNNTEKWNGTAWTEINDLNTGRRGAKGGGTSPDFLYFGGETSTVNILGITEEWNGSAWTETSDMNTARKDGMAAKKGTTSAGLGFGGNDGTADISASEEWSGSSITTKVLTD